MDESVEIIKLEPSRFLEAKAIRLKALICDPYSFSSTIEDTESLTDENWKERLEYSIREEKAITYYAQKDNKIIGMAGVFFKEDSLPEIFGMFVDKDYRGLGIASRLLKVLILKVNDMNKYNAIKLGVNITMLPAIGLYKKYGFEITSTEKDHIKKDGKSFDIYNMELKL